MTQLLKYFVNITKDRTYKCKLCGEILGNKHGVVEHTMNDHEAKQVMYQRYNMVMFLKVRH